MKYFKERVKTSRSITWPIKSLIVRNDAIFALFFVTLPEDFLKSCVIEHVLLQI